MALLSRIDPDAPRPTGRQPMGWDAGAMGTRSSAGYLHLYGGRDNSWGMR